jgi:CubicO group peptidase (beta-lactamase class C family)
MKRMTAIAIGLAWIACTAYAQAIKPADSTDPALKKKIDSIAAGVVLKGGPGFSVAVVKDQKVILCQAYGLANVELGVPMTTGSVLNIGSVSKHFTAWAILLLEQRGLLSTADDVHKVLPELPDYGTPLTISQLLHQTSGLPEYMKLFKYAGLFRCDYRGMDDVMGVLKNGAALESRPGTQWHYSNTNYALLAEIVKRRTGQEFGAWLHDNLFAPLGMSRTVVPESDVTIVENGAQSYWRSGGALKRYDSNDFIPGPSMVCTSAEDMARWMLNFKRNRIGGPELFDRLCTKGRLTNGEEVPYCMGMGRGLFRGKEAVGHTGDHAAFVADMTYCPEYDLGVAVLSNTPDIDPLRIRDAVLDYAIFGESAVKEEEQGAAGEVKSLAPGLAKTLRERLLGSYRMEGNGDVFCLSRDGEALWATYLGQGNVLLIPRDDSRASNDELNIAIRILDPKEGAADSVEMNLKGTLLKASRVPADPKEPEVLADSAGDYYSPVLDTVYSIAREGGGLKVSQRRSVGTHDLAYAAKDTLVCSLGELRLAVDRAGKVSGFTLWHERVSGGIPFRKIHFEELPKGEAGTR